MVPSFSKLLTLTIKSRQFVQFDFQLSFVLYIFNTNQDNLKLFYTYRTDSDFGCSLNFENLSGMLFLLYATMNRTGRVKKKDNCCALPAIVTKKISKTRNRRSIRYHACLFHVQNLRPYSNLPGFLYKHGGLLLGCLLHNALFTPIKRYRPKGFVPPDNVNFTALLLTAGFFFYNLVYCHHN